MIPESWLLTDLNAIWKKITVAYRFGPLGGKLMLFFRFHKQKWYTVMTVSLSHTIPDPSGVNAFINVHGGKNILIGSKATLVCTYTFDPDDPILTVSWQVGDDQSSASPVAFIIDPNTKNFIFPRQDLNIEPPAYNMTIEHGVSDGRSEFIIQSVTLDDERLFWCFVATVTNVNDVDSLRLSVNGKSYYFHISLSGKLFSVTSVENIILLFHHISKCNFDPFVYLVECFMFTVLRFVKGSQLGAFCP